jgi:hypothetical protein
MGAIAAARFGFAERGIRAMFRAGESKNDNG